MAGTHDIARLAFATAYAGGAYAQAAEPFPNRPEMLIVPTTRGSRADAVWRLIAVKLSDKWGVPVVVDKQAGAAIQLGSFFVAKSA